MSEHLLTNVENNELTEMLKLQVGYLMLGNLWEIETFDFSAVSVFHRFTLL